MEPHGWQHGSKVQARTDRSDRQNYIDQSIRHIILRSPTAPREWLVRSAVVRRQAA